MFWVGLILGIGIGIVGTLGILWWLFERYDLGGPLNW